MGAEHLEGPQNSDIRHATNGPLLKMARRFHHTRLFRRVSPDDVTCFGAITQPIGSAIAVLVMNKDPKELTWKDRLKAMIGTGGPQLPDGFDGKLNTVLKEEEPEKVNPDGDLHDFTADRWGEGVVAVQRAVSAYLRGDSTGELLAYLAGATNPLTSYYRAMAESRGRVVHELKWGLGALGNRFGRCGTSVLAAVSPEYQAGIDAASVVSNSLSAWDRREVALNGSEISLKGLRGEERRKKRAEIEHMQERARLRLKISEQAVPLTAAAMLGTAVTLRVINHFHPIRKIR